MPVSMARTSLVLRILLVAAIGASLLAGVGSATAASPSPSVVTLKIGYTSDADNLNPFIGYSTPSYEVWHLNYDLLVGYDTKDYSPAPEYAESWSTSADGLTWTFKIRHGMKWQDGVPATAKDAAFTYNYIIKNDMTAFSSFTKGIVEAVAVDDYTLELRCKAPKANMLRLWIPILPEHIWKNVKPEDAAAKFQNLPPIIGSGPFKTVEWKKGSYIKMVANPDYWGGRPKIDEVYFLAYQDADSMVQELKKGVIDAVQNLPPAQLKPLQATPGIKAISYSTPTYDYLAFNCYADKASLGNPILRDVKFRQALAWAIDRPQLVSIAYAGLAKQADTVIPPGTGGTAADWHWTPPADQTFGFDLQKAGAMLDAAGYPLKNGVRVDKSGKPISLRLWARSQSISSQKAGKLIAGWFGQLGLKIDFAIMDEDAISAKLYALKGNTYTPDYDMYLWDVYGYQDPGDTLAQYTAEQIQLWNDVCWVNPEYERLNTQQYEELDQSKRRALIWQMQQLLYENAPLIPIAYPASLQAWDTSRWAGWVRSPQPDGAAFYTDNNMATYLSVHPVTAEATTTSSTPWTTIIIVAAAVVIVAGLSVWLLRRRGAARREEM
jgi:peptide/nickel transport system substrate-binding protein